MHTVKATSASAASRIASAANRGGTKIMEVFAPVSCTASATVSYTGIPSTSWPPLPGVTPATTGCADRALTRGGDRPPGAGDALDQQLGTRADEDAHAAAPA